MHLSVNDTQLYVLDNGARDGVPLIFIHGFPFDHTMWDGQLRALPARIHAIAYDIRGFGKSEVGDGQYTIEMFVDDLFGMMDALDIPKAILCGLSMGGYIALRAIEREPHRVRGLVLCDTKTGADTNEGKLKRANGIKQIKKEGSVAYAEHSVKGLFCEKSLQEKQEAVYRLQKVMESTNPLALCGATLAMAGRTDTTSVLEKIQVPCLVMVGKEDGITPPDVAKEMYGAIKDADLHIIEDAGHVSNLEQPDIFNTHLLKWLDSKF